MQFKTIDNKRNIGNNIELLDTTFIPNLDCKLLDIFEVISGYEMRWDKISFKYYNSSDYADGLRKFNLFENPFSLNVGDLIKIPVLEELQEMYTQDKTSLKEPETVRKNITLTYDKNRKNFLDAKKKIPTENTGETTIKKNNDGSFTLAR